MATIRPNRVKQKLAAGQTVLSVGGIDSPHLVDLMGPTGVDAIWLEGEHGPVDFGHIPDLTRACDLWGMTSVVRVNALDYGTIYRSLDLGAQAHLRAPRRHRRGCQEVRRGGQVRARSAGAACSPAARAMACADYLQVANDHTLLIALIEDIRAVENLDEILKVDHHRRVLRRPLGPRRLDGPDRQADRSQGAGDGRGDAQAHRRRRPHRRHDADRQPERRALRRHRRALPRRRASSPGCTTARATCCAASTAASR